MNEETTMTEETPFVTHLCEVEGCTWGGIACFSPDNPIYAWEGNEDEEPPDFPPDHYYCGDHAQKAGFCWGCGEFWGGIESFDFGMGARSGLCENCLASGDFDDDDEDDEDDMDSVYSTYPFDAEEDWHDWRNE